MIIVRRAYRRRLPHYQTLGRTYFVTYSTGRWILPDIARTIALEHVVHDHRRKAFVHTAIVMPDHVHVVLTPIDENSLADVLHGIKGTSGRRINQCLSRSGPVWQHESFDHELRRAESLRAKM